MERARAGAKANTKEKTKITRVNAETRERARAEDKASGRKKTNVVQRAAAEAVANIRARIEAKKGNKEISEAEARAKDESESK